MDCLAGRGRWRKPEGNNSRAPRGRRLLQGAHVTTRLFISPSGLSKCQPCRAAAWRLVRNHTPNPERVVDLPKMRTANSSVSGFLGSENPRKTLWRILQVQFRRTTSWLTALETILIVFHQLTCSRFGFGFWKDILRLILPAGCCRSTAGSMHAAKNMMKMLPLALYSAIVVWN